MLASLANHKRRITWKRLWYVNDGLCLNMPGKLAARPRHSLHQVMQGIEYERLGFCKVGEFECFEYAGDASSKLY